MEVVLYAENRWVWGNILRCSHLGTPEDVAFKLRLPRDHALQTREEHVKRLISEYEIGASQKRKGGWYVWNTSGKGRPGKAGETENGWITQGLISQGNYLAGFYGGNDISTIYLKRWLLLLSKEWIGMIKAEVKNYFNRAGNVAQWYSTWLACMRPWCPSTTYTYKSKKQKPTIKTMQPVLVAKVREREK